MFKNILFEEINIPEIPLILSIFSLLTSSILETKIFVLVCVYSAPLILFLPPKHSINSSKLIVIFLATDKVFTGLFWNLFF